jgi:replicative DNA helicase
MGGRAYINDLALGVLTTDNIGYYAELVRDKALLRALIQAGTDIVAEGYEQDDAEIAIDKRPAGRVCHCPAGPTRRPNPH